jgi:hypothetical protein
MSNRNQALLSLYGKYLDISAALFTSYIILCIYVGYIIFLITQININQY